MLTCEVCDCECHEDECEITGSIVVCLECVDNQAEDDEADNGELQENAEFEKADEFYGDFGGHGDW